MMIQPKRALAALAVVLALAACKSELYTGLTEREANDIVATLTGAGIPASKASGDGGVTVNVEQARFAEAMALLNARGLPSRDYASMGDVFRKEGFVSTPTEERARLIYALSQELSRTIAEIDGVLSARIHVVLPESDMLGRELKPSSASVFVRYAPGSDVESFTSQIKLLVANSIEGLIYDNITVVMVPAQEHAEPAIAIPELRSVFGIWVHPASAGRLQAVLAGLGLLAVAGALAPVLMTLRRRSERSPQHLPVAADPDDGL